MTEPLLLAVDAGTGSCRAVIFEPGGNQVAMAQREYSHPEVPGVPGSQVFETARNWQLICACIREALATAGVSADAIAAVSATSMREGMVCYDAAGNEIWACPNVDSRSAAEATDLIERGVADDIYARAGDWVAITAPARFLWIARHEPEIFRAIRHVTMLGDWILQRLSGAWVTDASLGSSSGMFELAERAWSTAIVEACACDRAWFPPVVASGTVVGEVTRSAAEQTGLRPGMPVVAAGADTQLALAGIGVALPGSVTVIGGSFWQQTVLLDEPMIDPVGRLRTLCHTEPGQWMMEGIGFYCGLTMRWFRDAFCEMDGFAGFDQLEREAADVSPGSNGIVGIFANLMNAKRWVHASPAFVGFDVAHPERSGRRECLRAIEECAAYVALGHLRIAEEVTGDSFDSAVFTGGAANGVLWPQIVADVLGVPLHIPVVKESTALGAAMYAGVGAALYRDAVDAAQQLVRVERTIDPDPSAHTAYGPLYERWLALYDGQLALSERGLAPPLWRAAGT